MEKTVLLVEDDDFIHRTVKRTFRSSPYRIISAYTILEALHKYEESKPDLVLLDLNFPGRNGQSFLDYLRENGHQVPVIIITGVADLDSVKKLFEKGIQGYFRKPFDHQKLKQRVEELAIQPKSGERRTDRDGQDINRRVYDFDKRLGRLEEMVENIGQDITSLMDDSKRKVMGLRSRAEDLDRLIPSN